MLPNLEMSIEPAYRGSVLGGQKMVMGIVLAEQKMVMKR